MSPSAIGSVRGSSSSVDISSEGGEREARGSGEGRVSEEEGVTGEEGTALFSWQKPSSVKIMESPEKKREKIAINRNPHLILGAGIKDPPRKGGRGPSGP
jgi:hypothetical protein